MIKYISFDCYGTLIDWESGILNFFNSFGNQYPHDMTNEEVLKHYAVFESEEEKKGYRLYREILKDVLQSFASLNDWHLQSGDAYALADSIKDWPVFEDTVDALRLLKNDYTLAILSNVDDDLFTYSHDKMDHLFDYVYTAQQIGSYKPSIDNFLYLKNKLALTEENWMHVAQSVYHDHVPAAALGIDSVWIKRPSLAGDQGMTMHQDYQPTLKYSDLISFARAMKK